MPRSSSFYEFGSLRRLTTWASSVVPRNESRSLQARQAEYAAGCSMAAGRFIFVRVCFRFVSSSPVGVPLASLRFDGTLLGKRPTGGEVKVGPPPLMGVAQGPFPPLPLADACLYTGLAVAPCCTVADCAGAVIACRAQSRTVSLSRAAVSLL
ncbi:hypothetical protein MRX96_022790 [Rhipicephalus microplus]